MTTRAMQSNAHRKSQHEKTRSAVEFREISARARMKTPTRRPSTTPTMRPVDAEDSDDAVPGVTNLGVAALGALALANVALGILGIILLVLGMRESGHSAMDAMFANGGLNDTLFEKPDDAACVIGVLLMALSGYGLFGLWRRSKSVLMIYHVWALVAFIVVVYACAVMNIYKDASGAMVRSYWQTYRANHNITGVHFRAVGGAVVVTSAVTVAPPPLQAAPTKTATMTAATRRRGIRITKTPEGNRGEKVAVTNGHGRS